MLQCIKWGDIVNSENRNVRFIATSIKKIDIHAHVVPKLKKVVPGSIDDGILLGIYDKLNVEKGVVLPIVKSGDDAGELTNTNAELVVSAHPDRFVRFTSVDLNCCDNLYEFLRAEKEKGALGVGEIISNLYLDDEKVHNLFAACEKLNLPLLFHMSIAIGNGYGVVDDLGLPRLEKMLAQYPEVKVIGHSQPFWSEISKVNTEYERKAYPKGKVIEGRLPELLRKFDNLYCDLSAGSGANALMRDPEYAVKFINEFADRIMYGCDITLEESTYPYTFSGFLDRLVEDNEISENIYLKICRDNAIKLLGM